MTFTVNADLEVNGKINQYGEPLSEGTSLSFSRYVALLTQAGSDAPVATVLENDLDGTIVWTRAEAGSYLATLASAFPVGKTFVLAGRSNALSDSAAGNFVIVSTKRLSNNQIQLFTWAVDIADPPANRIDDMLLDTEIEIRVYS